MMSRDAPLEPHHALATRTAHLLSIARGARRRRVDVLIQRMQQPNSHTYLVDALRSHVPEAIDPNGPILAADCQLCEIKGVKNRAKALFAKSESLDARDAGIAAYFLSIASALRYHNVMITTRQRASVAADLLDLATLMPQPFEDVLAEAALACDEDA